MLQGKGKVMKAEGQSQCGEREGQTEWERKKNASGKITEWKSELERKERKENKELSLYVVQLIHFVC